MRSLRVAMQMSSPLGPRSGGPGTFVQGSAEALRRNPHLDVVVIAPEEVQGGPGRRGSQLRLALNQFRELRRLRPDVVHAHGHPALLAAAVAYRVLSRGSARVVFTSHIDPADRGSWWSRWILGWLLSQSSLVTVFARDSIAKLDLIATPPPSAAVVRVVAGAATVRVRKKSDPAVRAFAESIGCSSGPVLLQVSNFVFPAKVAGTLCLLEAMVAVRERFPDVRLIILGTGPLVGSVREACARLRLTGAVTIPGAFIEDLSLPVALSDLHCHISGQDASPISIVEAMHAAKPVIASRTGGIPEAIEHGVSGILVDNKPAEIAAAIIDLLTHPERAEALGRRAQQVAQARFTWDRVAADFERIYGAPARPRAVRTGSECVNLVD